MPVMFFNLMRKVLMKSTAPSKNEQYDPGVVGASMYRQMMMKRRDYLKNPVVLTGTLLAWIALMRFLKPHSERVSFAEHRFRLLLQFSSFVAVLGVATYLRGRNKKLYEEH